MEEAFLKTHEQSLWDSLYRTVHTTSVATVLVNNLLDTEVIGQHRGQFLAALVTLEKANERRRRAQRVANVVLAVPRAALRLLGFKQPEPERRADEPRRVLQLQDLLEALRADRDTAAQIAKLLDSTSGQVEKEAEALRAQAENELHRFKQAGGTREDFAAALRDCLNERPAGKA